MTKNMVLFKIICSLTWLTLATCENDTRRVIGGETVSIEATPFMALLRPVGASYHCGASIVGDKFLISAAHCVNLSLTMEITVGTDQALSGGERYAIEKIIKHPEYNIGTQFNNDIAVVVLKNRLKFNNRVQPIKLAERNIYIEETAQFHIIGFGRTEYGQSSNELLKAGIPYVPNSQCAKYEHFSFVTQQMICAGKHDKGGCKGDSGGPLVYGDTLVGVVSFVRTDCKSVTVFARISALRDFIDNVMKNN